MSKNAPQISCELLKILPMYTFSVRGEGFFYPPVNTISSPSMDPRLHFHRTCVGWHTWCFFVALKKPPTSVRMEPVITDAKLNPPETGIYLLSKIECSCGYFVFQCDWLNRIHSLIEFTWFILVHQVELPVHIWIKKAWKLPLPPLQMWIDRLKVFKVLKRNWTKVELF